MTDVSSEMIKLALSAIPLLMDPSTWILEIVASTPINPPAPALVDTCPARRSSVFCNSERTVRFLERMVPPMFATRVGWNISSLLDTPTASVPPLKPKESDVPSGVLEPSTDISSAVTVEERIRLWTVGFDTTVVTEPPPAIDTSPIATDSVPT